jgi:hypothetical protein
MPPVRSFAALRKDTNFDGRKNSSFTRVNDDAQKETTETRRGIAAGFEGG